MGNVKFTVSNGRWTISYDGSEDFLNTGFVESIKLIVGSGVVSSGGSSVQVGDPNEDLDPASDTNIGPLLQTMTINNICDKLQCKTGPDLVLAACIYMTHIEGKDMLPRQDILQIMKDATRYFKATYASNLSAYLATLTKAGKLRERTKGVFFLDSAISREMEAILA